MKFVKKIDSVFEVFSINKNIFLIDNEKKEIINVSNNNHLPINYVRYSKNYIYDILVGEILIYDDSFKIVSKIIDPENTQFNSSIEENDNGWVLLLSRRDSERKLISEFKIISNNKIIHQNRYCGKILSNNFLLNLKYEERFNPRYFRCSDLLDTTTYWEYDCGEGYVANRFYVWNETLLFVKSKDLDAQLVLIELTSGNIAWQASITHGEFNIDENKGLLVSVWGNKHVGNNYQIVDLAKKQIETGQIEFNIEFENVNVNWQLQYLYENKLYFVDNLLSYGSVLRPIKFGCFDIVAKKIDFLQEVPQAAGGGFSQVFYQDKNLYLRTANNELFIFEDETST